MEVRFVQFSLDESEADFGFSSQRNARGPVPLVRLPNAMGRGSSLDSGGMIGFALFWVATSLPFLLSFRS